MRDVKEKEWIQHVKNGKSEYMEYIVSAYYTEIYSYLCRKLGSETEAQDVAQEVFIKFYANIHSYQERGKLKNYLLKLATNASNDMFRKSRQMISLDEAGEQQDIQMSPLEVIEQKERSASVKEALQKLSLQQREAVSPAA